MIKIRFKHPDFGLIVKAELEWDGKEASVKTINFGLPQKASKLEKLLLKYVEIYCHDVLRNNMINVILESNEYKRFVAKQKKLANA